MSVFSFLSHSLIFIAPRGFEGNFYKASKFKLTFLKIIADKSIHHRLINLHAMLI
jgi:hypothetical protein